MAGQDETPEAGLLMGALPACWASSKRVTRAFDLLAADSAWTAAKQQRLDAMCWMKPTKTAAVVASARDEGIYVLEWLAHHRAVGFEKVFIYTNDNRDGSDALYDVLDRHGVITCKRNEVRPGVSPQRKAYEHSIFHLAELRQFEWVGYFDLDEFLVPSAKHDHDVVQLTKAAKAAHPAELPAVIFFNWRWFGSDGRVEYEPGLVRDQFVHAIPHVMVKSLARLPDVRSMRRIHYPDLIRGFGVNSALQATYPGRYCSIATEYDGGQVNHYYHRSFAEFCIKHDRGEGSEPKGRAGKPFATFFDTDVPAVQSNRHPMPDLLRARADRELERLCALPGVAAAARHVQERSRQLQSAIIGGDVRARYEEQRKFAQSRNGKLFEADAAKADQALTSPANASLACEAPMTEADEARALFDAGHYLSQRPDLVAAGADPWEHYRVHGWREGTAPHPLVDPRYYAGQAGADTPPLTHYLLGGFRHGLSPHPLFDLAFYLAQAGALHEAPLLHYRRLGAEQGLSPHPLFDPAFYRAQQPNAGIDPFHHYLLHGWKDGAAPHPLFDPKHYLEQRPDLRGRGIEPLGHYLAYGWREGAWPHPLFDPKHYRSQATPDEAELVHYLREGEAAGVWPNSRFAPFYYKMTHAALLGDSSPWRHFVEHGQALGLSTAPDLNP